MDRGVRAAARSGELELEQEAGRLRELVRSGLLDELRLELASRAGHPAAGALVPSTWTLATWLLAGLDDGALALPLVRHLAAVCEPEWRAGMAFCRPAETCLELLAQSDPVGGAAPQIPDMDSANSAFLSVDAAVLDRAGLAAGLTVLATRALFGVEAFHWAGVLTHPDFAWLEGRLFPLPSGIYEQILAPRAIV